MPRLDEMTSQTDDALRQLARQYRSQLPDLRSFLIDWIKENRGKDRMLRSQVSLQLVYGLIDRAGMARYFDTAPFLKEASQLAQGQLEKLGIEAGSGLSAPSLRSLQAALAGAGLDFLEGQEGIRETAKLQLTRVRENVASAVRQILLEMQVVPKSLRVAGDQLSSISSLSAGQATTIINTALSSQVQSVQLDAGRRMERGGIETLYIYAGPKDELGRRSRPFCQRILDLAFTKAQIAQLNNGQGLSCILHGGGYNCRHEWIPVPASYADKEYRRAKPRDIEAANNLARRRR